MVRKAGTGVPVYRGNDVADDAAIQSRQATRAAAHMGDGVGTAAFLAGLAEAWPCLHRMAGGLLCRARKCGLVDAGWRRAGTCWRTHGPGAWTWPPLRALVRWVDASLPVFAGVFLLGLLFDVIEPFGLDNASKAQSQRITARVLAPFYRSDAQDHIAVVMIDDHTLEARGVGWPPQYAYYDEVVRRILAQRPRAVYLDILMQQRRDYDDSYEDARLGIGEEVVAAGIPVYFGVAAPGGRSLFSQAGGARDVVTSWQGAGADYPLSIYGDYINAQGAALGAPGVAGAGADERSVALALYEAACGGARAGCTEPAAALSAPARAQPMAVQWGSTRPRGPAAVACTRRDEVGNAARMAVSLELLWDSFNSGRDEQVEDRNRERCAYTFTVFEEQLDEDAMRDALADRVVLVGTHLTGLNDRVLSPVHQQIPGVYLHAMALDNLMTWGERRAHRTEGANLALALLNAVLLSLAAGMVLLAVRGTTNRMVLIAVLSALLGMGVAVFAQLAWRQPPQDWIGLLGLALAVTYYVVNLGQQRPQGQEQDDGQGEQEGARYVGDAGGAGGGNDGMGVDGTVPVESPGDPGHQ